MNEQVLIPTVIGLSLVFIFTNGFQDGSSVTATAIASRSLTPAQTITLVASAEFLGALLGGSAVANTIQAITNCPADLNLLPVLSSGLLAAIIWNFLTRFVRFPSSSTHALVGGIVGAIITQTGNDKFIVWGSPDNLIHPSGLWKVLVSLFLSPLIGFLAGYLCLILIFIALLRSSTKVNRPLKSMQWLTVGALAFGHGANDTQKAMGVMLLCLKAVGIQTGDEIPLWVRLSTGIVMALGIISLAHGIVKRVGSGIFKIQPVHALASQIASASVILVGSATGGPVAASQVIASTVIGVGSAQRKKGVHWLVARDMLVAWFLTIPGSALLASLIHLALVRHFH
ncbi:MAG: inorganic phosphate transporter [Candidatus Melainabacteria bacterium]|nr:MAG: inorganic phosphate transporter [Candidatus Melainabacteria bacterium]